MPSAPAPETHTPEYWEQLHQMAGGKTTDAMRLALGFWNYASDHQGQCPSNIDQIVPYLAKDKLSLSGTNQFEIVYQGSQNDLTNIPPRRVALIRERKPWLTPDGKWARVYGSADGAASIIVSDDNFQSWDAQHIIPSRAAGQQ